MDKIYFDYAATAPVDPNVVAAMEPYYFKQFGNPSSPHSIGQESQKALEESRQSIAGFIGAKPEEIIFNSGATEGNNHAIFGLAHSLKAKGNHIIISSVEHHSVLEPIEHLRKEGFSVTYLTVDRQGLIDPQEVKRSITDKTILVAVMHASNEIGTIQPIAQIARMAKERQVYLLVDAAQSVGHIPADVNELGADFLTFSAHKFYGPKGVGALFVRKGIKLSSFLMGGDQERNRRASTQNVAGVVGMAKAVELCQKHMKEESISQGRLRDRLIKEVLKLVDGVCVNGHLQKRLPNNAHFSFEKISGESLLMSLDMAGICASMGSACTSGAMEPSHVLRAIGLSDSLAMGSLRISLGRWSSQKDVDSFLERLPAIIKSLRV